MRADVHRGPNDVNHRKLARALAARSTSEAVGPERRQRPSSDLRRSPAPAKDRPSRATRLLASESTPRGDILALQPVHRSRWTACRRGSAAPPTMVLEENVLVSGVSLPSLPGGKGVWRGRAPRVLAAAAGVGVGVYIARPTTTRSAMLLSAVGALSIARRRRSQPSRYQRAGGACGGVALALLRLVRRRAST